MNNKDIKNIKEELGDLLLQVVLFSQVSKDNNMFSFKKFVMKLQKKLLEDILKYLILIIIKITLQKILGKKLN